jgi:hypothetical protein
MPTAGAKRYEACTSSACVAAFLCAAPAAMALPSGATQSNDLSIGALHTELLGALASPAHTELSLTYHHCFDAPSLRLGLGVGWQRDSPWVRLPIDAFIDAALVFRGPYDWRPFAGLEAGWTGFDQLEPQAGVWPTRITALHQRSVSHYYVGSVVAPLHFRHRKFQLSSLTVHLAAMGHAAHYLRFQLELLQVGASW